ncbi:hypothetical protein MMC12_005656 [Toensbergia leucococca]|nr:hypothetical protein [Toensbergia leucococca]
MDTTTGTSKLTGYELYTLNDTRVPTIVGVNSVLIGLAIVTVGARFYARRLKKLPLKTDDYLMIPGLALFVETVLYVFAHFSIKLSILLLYRRIFTTVDRSFNIALYCTICYVVAWSVGSLVAIMLTCVPLAKVWDRTLKGSCNFNAYQVAVPNFLSAAADIVILLLPSIILWKMQMSIGRKIGLTSLFLVGTLTCAASFARAGLSYYQTADITWSGTELYIWTAIEITIGLICACFPVIAPAFSGDFFKKTVHTSSFGRFMQRLFSASSSARDLQAGSKNVGAGFPPGLWIEHWSESDFGEKAMPRTSAGGSAVQLC